MDKQMILDQLVSMSRSLGRPERDYVILGEGNTSARIDAGSFWVKASGVQLHEIEPEGFVEVQIEPIVTLLQKEAPTDAEVIQGFLDARVNKTATARPSIEASMHAVIYSLCGSLFIGHTHPVAVNAVLCSIGFDRVLNRTLFPDQIVFLGLAPVLVPYIEPGLPLARLVKQSLETYLDSYAEPPKVIYLQNHGVIALGKTPKEVESITAMAVKASRILMGTGGLGGPHFLSDQEARRIDTHPSEAYRRQRADDRPAAKTDEP